MKRWLNLFLATLLSAGFAAGAAELAPDALVKSTADEVLQVIRTTKDKAALRAAAEQKVLPHFDFRAMTQLAVGQHWRQASPEHPGNPRGRFCPYPPWFRPLPS